MTAIDIKMIKALNHIDQVNNIMHETTYGLPISYFFYSKLFDDNTRIMLSSDVDWLKDFNIKYNNLGLASSSFHSYQSGYLLWPVSGKEEIYSIMRKEYSISNQITFTLREKDFCELFTFATNDNIKNMHNTYINNLDLFYKISLHLRDKIKSIIQQCNSDRYLLTKSLNDCGHNNQHDSIVQVVKDNSIASYLKALMMDRDYSKYLTDREYECLLFTIEGKSAKQIATLFGISQRTVEAHLDNIKAKFNCKSKTELIYKIMLSTKLTDKWF